jgi:hypothetical protein
VFAVRDTADAYTPASTARKQPKDSQIAVVAADVVVALALVAAVVLVAAAAVEFVVARTMKGWTRRLSRVLETNHLYLYLYRLL